MKTSGQMNGQTLFYRTFPATAAGPKTCRFFYVLRRCRRGTLARNKLIRKTATTYSEILQKQITDLSPITHSPSTLIRFIVNT